MEKKVVRFIGYFLTIISLIISNHCAQGGAEQVIQDSGIEEPEISEPEQLEEESFTQVPEEEGPISSTIPEQSEQEDTESPEEEVEDTFCQESDLIVNYEGPLLEDCLETEEFTVLDCLQDFETCTKTCQTQCLFNCEENQAKTIFNGPEPGSCEPGYSHHVLECQFNENACQLECKSECQFNYSPKAYTASAFDPEFDMNQFNLVLSDEIFDRVKGYAFTLSDPNGQLVAWGYGGIAREKNSEDGFQPYTHETIQHVGSVSKLFMAATMLHAIENNPNVLIHDPMQDFLADRWAVTLHPDFYPVTLSLLLQHKTGLNKDGSIKGGDGPNIGQRLALGEETEKGVGYRYYSNATGLLGQMLTAKISDPVRMSLEENSLLEIPLWDFDTYDVSISFAGGYTYFDHMSEYVLKPAQVIGSCHHGTYWDANYALLYPNPSSQEGQKVLGQDGLGDQIPYCAQGGFATSAIGLQRFLATLKYSEKIISQETYQLMENLNGFSEKSDESGGEVQALGYSRFKTTTDGVAICHGGDFQNGHANVCSFPNGYQAAIVANSNGAAGDSIGSFQLRGMMVKAYNGALK